MITGKKYTTYTLRKKEVVWLVAGLLAIGMFVGVALACTVMMISSAEAEDLTYPCWIMCKPGSEVMIREKPDKRAGTVGAAASGRRMWTDWQEKNGWLHLVDVNNETGEGWIYEGYIVFTEPREVNAEMTVSGSGRVACRKCISGKLKTWAKVGSTVTVYMTDGEWAVTDRGYIQWEYIGVK